MKKSRFVIIIGFLMCSAVFLRSACAQLKAEGEIINVNYDYQVAFTDLLKGQVEAGDVVEVWSDGKFLTYLEVIETSSVLTKMGFVNRKGIQTEEESFKQLKIGNPVKAFQQGQALESMNAVISQLSELQVQYDALNKEVGQKDQQILDLKNKNGLYVKEIERLKQKEDVLKENLEQISRLLSEKITDYESR